MAISSNMLALGTTAPPFSLPDTEGNIVSLADARGPKGLLVVFMCNHCPYVKHVRAELAKLGRELPARGVGMVGINSNDVEKYPDDSPALMREEVKLAGYSFPYLYDESQSVAHAYSAACTPDFFLFDAELRLYYRGQLDDSRPSNGMEVSGSSLRAAVDQLLAGAGAPGQQRPSLGCGIKWKPGNEPQ